MPSLPPMPPSETTVAILSVAEDTVVALQTILGVEGDVEQFRVKQARLFLASVLAEMYFHAHPKVKPLQPAKVPPPERDPRQDAIEQEVYELLRRRQDERCQQMGGGG